MKHELTSLKELLDNIKSLQSRYSRFFWLRIFTLWYATFLWKCSKFTVYNHFRESLPRDGPLLSMEYLKFTVHTHFRADFWESLPHDTPLFFFLVYNHFRADFWESLPRDTPLSIMEYLKFTVHTHFRADFWESLPHDMPLDFLVCYGVATISRLL